MKTFILACALLGTACLPARAQDDPVVMRINNKDVTRSEFEYNFNKNNVEGVVDRKSLEEYVDLFVNYKLKVAAAEEARYDTLSSFQREFRTYRDQQIRPLLVTPAAEETEALAYYNQMKENIGPAGLVLPAHIFVRLPQKATSAVQQAAKARIDSIYTALQGGADFETLAKTCSEDKMSGARGGVLGWIGPKQTLKEFEDVAYSLQKGEMSAPFLSTVGYHIVLMKDRKQVEPFEEIKPQILAFLEQRGLKDRIATQVVDSMAQASQGLLTAEQIMDREAERLAARDADLKNLIQEYHDGLLLYEISSKEVWNKAAQDEAGLERYFKKNKSKYKWDAPRYSGIVYFCRQKSDVAKVKAALKKVPEEQWVEKLRATFNSDSVQQVKVERRLFKKGDNAFVDHLAFKSGDAPKAQKSFPYAGVCGKMLKKGPKKWTDVRSEVVSDYQNQMDEEFVKALRERYKIEIFKEVLNTVNKH